MSKNYNFFYFPLVMSNDINWWEGLSETLKIFYKSLTLIKKEVLLKNEPIKTANAKMSSNTYQVPIAPPTR